MDEFPEGAEVIPFTSFREDELIVDLVQQLDLAEKPPASLCIDATGFMRPQLLFLMRYLADQGLTRFDMLYSEPSQYSRKSETQFARSSAFEIRQVSGYEGSHSTDLSNDILLIGVGYDHDRIGQILASKESAKLVQLHAFPSLSSDMYHESLLRLNRIDGTLPRIAEDQVFFASANDPFVTAAVISDEIRKLNARRRITNLYLSPLATKAQTIGFGLYYLRERSRLPTSVIFPFSETYNRQTSSGVGRIWKYPIDLSN
ncbi:hypothetical protein RYZ27_01255 [Hyphomonas sp. FCG-A18]|uniref:hypothetical protein n=1 Tax=Hyphomonas sp. FCG-A18 TaxID=3080019 RepID=UPI002B3182D4|nr:hypothetical protein RYZ27_01255 [Hyphomonas sp. FCG-A18]